MDDPLLVGVLNCVADLDEELDPLLRREAALVAVLVQLFAGHVLHREPGTAIGRRAGVVNPRDGGVVHDREGLPLRLEAAQELLGVHPDLDKLEGDLATQTLDLLGQPDLAHAPFGDQLDELVGADAVAGA